MPKKKTNSSTMDPRIEELERRIQDSENQNQRRFDEQQAQLNAHEAKMDEVLAILREKLSGPSGPGDPKSKEKPNNAGNHKDGELRLRKVDLPVFNGDDAPGWLTKIERFFKVRKIDENEKLDAALMAMEGEALSWMQWWESNSEVQSWNGLKEAILRRFQPTVVTNAFEMLMNMKQEGTVREYRKKFEAVASHIKVQDHELFSGMFSNGLRDDVRAEVRLQRPKSLVEMMEIALLAEEKLGAANRYGGKSIGWMKNTTKACTDTATTGKGAEPVKNTPAANTKSVGSKEIEERRRKGTMLKNFANTYLLHEWNPIGFNQEGDRLYYSASSTLACYFFSLQNTTLKEKEQGTSDQVLGDITKKLSVSLLFHHSNTVCGKLCGLLVKVVGESLPPPMVCLVSYVIAKTFGSPARGCSSGPIFIDGEYEGMTTVGQHCYFLGYRYVYCSR